MAFHAETVPEILAAVIKEEPDWFELPAATPMRVRVLLHRCLQKDAKQRLRDIGDASHLMRISSALQKLPEQRTLRQHTSSDLASHSPMRVQRGFFRLRNRCGAFTYYAGSMKSPESHKTIKHESWFMVNNLVKTNTKG